MARADFRNWAFGTVAAAVLLAGCGGGEDSSAGVLRGLARSPFSYLFYGREWWGRDPHVRVLALHVRGNRATVVLAASGTVDEHLALVRGRRHAWRVVSAEGGLVTGPYARRRAAIPWPCRRSRSFVSRIDPDWAVVLPRCPTGNGDVLLQRAGDRWETYDEASDPFDCREAPPGVIRGLLGVCRASA